MNWPIYTTGVEDAAAAKITALTPLRHPVPGSLTISFGDINKQTHAHGDWCRDKNPQVGQWYVCPESGGVNLMWQSDFAVQYSLKAT